MNKDEQFLYLGSSTRLFASEHFTRLLETSYGYIKFFFNKIHTAQGVQYHISCMGPNRKVYTLQMAEILRHWHLTPVSKCPLWIKILEQEFEEAINDSLI